MAPKKPESADVLLHTDQPGVARPRLHKLVVKNFCAIGETPVEIELDDIVVLVGPNNAGKSSILRAYEVVMSHGSKKADLTADDFHGGARDGVCPEIELQTVIYDNSPGHKWIFEDPTTNERIVRERWRWPAPGPPIRQGYDVEAGAWSDKVPWGAPNVANSRRPQPHRVDAFAVPEKQSEEILKLLSAVLEDRVKTHKALTSDDGTAPYAQLLKSIAELQAKIVEESDTELKKIEEQLTEAVSNVFPGYEVAFDSRHEDDLDKSLALFRSTPQLMMGPSDGHKTTVSRQGSGARRTLLWTALKILRENEATKSAKGAEMRPHVLLLDEPELCLHPNAIREARRVLYGLPASGNWQVMITTHSPVFIDLASDNTTIVRVERDSSGEVTGTTLFRPHRANLDNDDRARLKLLNLCDPYVNEFFFGGRIIVVEGDTEYTAFRYIAERVGDEFRDLQVIRARGKYTIVSIVKVLNHFGVSFSVLHDSDRPTILGKSGQPRANSAWAANEKIRATVVEAPHPERVHLVASIPNFESAFFGADVDGDKPYTALSSLEENQALREKLLSLLRGLTDPQASLPANALRWTSVDALKDAVGA